MKTDMTRICSLLSLLLIVVNIHANEDEMRSATEIQTSYEQPFESQILQFGLENLNYLKSGLPDLHSIVMSAKWETMNGQEQLQVVVDHALSNFGAEREDLDGYLARIDDHVSSVSQQQKVQLFGSLATVAETLLHEVMYFELDKDGMATLADTYSIIWKDSTPERLAGFRECLNGSADHMKASVLDIFGRWVDSMDEIPANADIVVPHVKLHAETKSELIQNRMDSLEYRKNCDQVSVD